MMPPPSLVSLAPIIDRNKRNEIFLHDTVMPKRTNKIMGGKKQKRQSLSKPRPRVQRATGPRLLRDRPRGPRARTGTLGSQVEHANH